MSTPLWVTTTRGTSVGTATIEADDDLFTITAHGLVDGQQVTVASLTGGASVLVADAPYFAANVTANTFQLRPSPGAPVMTFTLDGGCAVYQAAGIFDGQTLRDAFSGLVAKGGDTSGGFQTRPGVFSSGNIANIVTLTGMTWASVKLVASVPHSTGGMYIVAHDTDGGSITAADPSQPRIDALDLQIQDNALDSSGFARGRIVYTAGTPAAVPVAPTVTANSERLVTISVPAGSTTPTILTNPRSTTARGGVLPVADSTEYPSSGGRYEGMVLWDRSLDQLLVNTNNGSTWVPVASADSYASIRRLATTIRTSNTSTFTAETSINTVTASLVSGKTYRVSWRIGGTSSVANDVIRYRLREDNLTGTQLQLRNAIVPVATSAWPCQLEAEFTAASTGSKTFAGTAQRVIGTGNITCTGSAIEPAYLYVDYIRG